MAAVGIQPTETRSIQNLVVLITGQIRKLRLREETPHLHKVTRGWALGLRVLVSSASPTSGSPWVGQGMEGLYRVPVWVPVLPRRETKAEREVTQPNAGETLS